MNPIKDQTPIIYLAMFWGGGGSYTISQIIHVYDWINRDIPNRKDLETALNTLLFLNFITMQDDKFSVMQNIGNDFDKYNKKNKRKSKFENVRMFFKQYDPLPEIPVVVEVSEKTYSKELAKYKESF
ncbi:MAG: hypothetical protein K8R54_12800 [Bacteroidales bacterium]|nr:hypothetical protein [Bacteroidales bacterium]